MKKLKRLVFYDCKNCLSLIYELPVDLRVLKMYSLSKEKYEIYLKHSRIEILDLDSSYSSDSGNFNPKCLVGLTNLKHLCIKQSYLKRINLTNPVIQKLTSLSLKRKLYRKTQLE